MEEEKAAAYYDELTRKGGGAARFKQGLGFSSSPATISDEPPARGSSLPSATSSFLGSFVRASSPSKTKVFEKESQLLSIQNKLKKKEDRSSFDGRPSEKTRVRVSRSPPRRRSRSRDRDRNSRRSRSRSRDRNRDSRRSRSRSRERRSRRERSGGSEEERDRRRRRYRSSSRERRDRDRDRDRDRGRRRSEKGREDGRKDREKGKEVDGKVDYAKLIGGYDQMTLAERIKAKMKLQLSKTAEKDAKIGSGSGWERFEFDKDAPVDDEVIEAGDDDAAVVKHINKTFRFASLETKREDELQAAHDNAMFGAPAARTDSHTSDSEEASENEKKEIHDDDEDAEPDTSLINEKVIAKQQGSWRDRARRNVG